MASIVLVELILWTFIPGLVLMGFSQRLFGSQYKWLGAVIGIVVGIFSYYPAVVLLPSQFWGELLFAYDNLDFVDLSSPVNATFILYASMFLYLSVAALAMIMKLGNIKFKRMV